MELVTTTSVGPCMDARALARFESKFAVEPNTGCWLWLGTVNANGYGVINLTVGERKAHRVSYEHYVGPIPAGLQLDHLCRQRCCVNPDHLEPVTNAENVRRGECGRAGRQKTHCDHGHPFSEHGGYKQWRHGHRFRYCRKCSREQTAARRQKTSAA